MLRTLNWLEAHEWDLHREDRAHTVDDTVGDINSIRKATGRHQGENVQRNQIDQEHVAAPRRHHVEIGECGQRRPQDRSSFHRLDPHVVGEQHAEDGNSLVVIGPSHRPRDISWHDTDHGGCHQSRSGALQEEDGVVNCSGWSWKKHEEHLREFLSSTNTLQS